MPAAEFHGSYGVRSPRVAQHQRVPGPDARATIIRQLLDLMSQWAPQVFNASKIKECHSCIVSVARSFV